MTCRRISAMSFKMFRLITISLLFIFSASKLAAQSTSSSAPSSAPPYLDPSLPIDQRVNDLVSRMTLEEKASQMQDVAVAIPRLNIPAYNWWNEGLHGVARAGNATVFPQAIGLAATWDSNLIHSVADVISTEARAKYNDASLHNNTGRYYGLTFWSPNINIFRDRPSGRGLALPQVRFHSETLRRSQWPRNAPPSLQRSRLSPRSLRHLYSCLSRHDYRRPRRLRHVCLQLDPRRTRLRQSTPLRSPPQQMG